MRALQHYIIFSLLPILSRFSMEQNFQQPDYTLKISGPKNIDNSDQKYYTDRNYKMLYLCGHKRTNMSAAAAAGIAMCIFGPLCMHDFAYDYSADPFAAGS